MSPNYSHSAFITPLAGRASATLSVTMQIGFGSQLNAAPVAQDDVRSRPPGSGVSISASSLFANDFDPDGDPLSVVGVDEQSLKGGTLSLAAQTITYTPPAGFTGTDQFSYVVADANGDIATAIVILGTAPPVIGQAANTVIIAEQSDGKYLVRFRQIPGKTEYTIQYKHDLNDPTWHTLKTVEAGADGIVEALFDPSVAVQTFFRALTL